MTIETRLKVHPASKINLRKSDPSATPGAKSRSWAKRRLAENLSAIADLQYRLYAERKQSLLIVLQGMDCSGKSGVIRRVMSAANPLGIRVHPFKTPTQDELAHDFLWRVHSAAPARGMIAVFDRSHYEDVLIVRVHNIAPCAMRYDQINSFERLLKANGTTIVKLYLHISRSEQAERLRARLEDRRKNWKFNPRDLAEREYWDAYRRAYEAVLRKTSTEIAPWYLIPADRKWYRNNAVSEIIRETQKTMSPKLPAFEGDVKL